MKKLTVIKKTTDDYRVYYLDIEIDSKSVLLRFTGKILNSYTLDDLSDIINEKQTTVDETDINYHLTEKELIMFNNLHCFKEDSVKFFILNYLTRTNIINL